MTVYQFISNNIDRTVKTCGEKSLDGLDIPLIPLPYPFEEGKLILESDGEIVHGQKGSLKEACLYANSLIAPPSGKRPPTICFTAPQYCTWMELLYGQN